MSTGAAVVVASLLAVFALRIVEAAECHGAVKLVSHVYMHSADRMYACM